MPAKLRATCVPQVVWRLCCEVMSSVYALHNLSRLISLNFSNLWIRPSYEWFAFEHFLQWFFQFIFGFIFSIYFLLTLWSALPCSLVNSSILNWSRALVWQVWLTPNWSLQLEDLKIHQLVTNGKTLRIVSQFCNTEVLNQNSDWEFRHINMLNCDL